MEKMTKEQMKNKIDRLEKIVKNHEERIQALEGATGMGKPEPIEKREPSTLDFPRVGPVESDKDEQ